MTTTTSDDPAGRAHVSTVVQIVAITRTAVRDRLVLVTTVAVLLVAMGALTGALWPSLQDAFADLPAALSDGLGTVLAGADLTSPVGWMNAEMVSLVVPGGLIAVAAISAAKGVAGEEQAKSLGVLLSAPVSRVSFLVAKTAAMVVNVLLATIGAAAGIVLGDRIGGLGIDTAGVLGTCAHAALLAIVFGAVAVLASAITGDPRLSSSVAGGLAALAFGLNAFLPLSSTLADFARVSPWYYFAHSNPLADGPDYGHLAVLSVSAVVILGLAVVAYRRRDLNG
ncbi:ABC transporter permease subunit [Dietzia alimentaria]|uniref:ABC transporter permease subunit n=1 Tax=Dietzia alimentaria TaxID=665550 RepID=UPI00029AF4F6|nr:ABC transporter permease subunit [Dietzia alimentaria]